MDDDTVQDERFESFVQLHETPEEVDFEVRAQEGALWTGGRLLIGIWAFAFAALAFAYFYLRSANNENLWRPRGITAPTGIGAAIFAITVACALLALFGNRRFRAGQTLDWEVAGWVSVLGALLVVGLQIYQLTELPFFPGSSGYASCFIGWAAMNIALVLAGGYWLETLLAREIRLRRAMAQDGGAPRSALPAARLFRANLEGCTYFWGFIAVVATFFWVLFYVI
jgi:heme/copper-type cytochrome/quinol oxidase subunit 3